MNDAIANGNLNERQFFIVALLSLSKDIVPCLDSDDCKEPWVCLLCTKGRLSFLMI